MKRKELFPEDRESNVAARPELGLPFIASVASLTNDDIDNGTTTGTWDDPDGSDNT